MSLGRAFFFSGHPRIPIGGGALSGKDLSHIHHPMKTRLNAGYHQTVFEFIPAGKPNDFWVLAANNPKGKPADPGDNIAADARLHADLTKLEITPFRVTGLSPAETHAEPGWGLPCAEATALAIGLRYRQQAVYHFPAGHIDLVDCKTREREPLEETSIKDQGVGEFHRVA